jgi:multimeric flavodoxin WrbA
MAKIVALSCTQKRSTSSLTDWYLDCAIDGYLQQRQDEISRLRLIDYHLELCVGNDECLRTGLCPLKDDFYDVVARADGAAGMILCTPVYGGNVPAIFKIFSERLKTFMSAEVRPFGGLKICTIVHSRTMLTEAAMGALSPWFQRLKNQNVVSICLTKGDLSDVVQSKAGELCTLAGAQFAMHINGIA